MVAGNKDLLAWSLSAAAGQRIDFGRTIRPDRKRRLLDEIEKVKQQSEFDWPEKIRSPRRERDRDREKQVDLLLAKRESKAEELELEAAVLGSRAGLEAYVAGDSSRLMAWQKSVMNLE